MGGARGQWGRVSLTPVYICFQTPDTSQGLGFPWLSTRPPAPARSLPLPPLSAPHLVLMSTARVGGDHVFQLPPSLRGGVDSPISTPYSVRQTWSHRHSRPCPGPDQGPETNFYCKMETFKPQRGQVGLLPGTGGWDLALAWTSSPFGAGGDFDHRLGAVCACVRVRWEQVRVLQCPKSVCLIADQKIFVLEKIC